MVKLLDIAQAAGVTQGTVSAALSGRGRLCPATRERIQNLAKAMGYTPNLSAQMLKKQTIIDIGYLINDYNNAALGDFLHSCSVDGLRCQLEMLGNYTDFTPMLLNPGYCKGILYNGAITPAIQNFIDTHPEFPFVTVNEKSPFCVRADFKTGVRSAFEYLIARGHHQIAIALCNAKGDEHNQVAAAVEEVLQNLDLADNPAWRGSFPHDPNQPLLQESTREWVAEILDRDERPTAFFCAGMQQARAVVYEAMKRGISIPEKLSIIAIGKPSLAQDAFPFVTALCPNFERNVKEGLRLLRERIAHRTISTPSILTETIFTPRQTTNEKFIP